MKRRIFQIVVLLLLGAIVNIAVAWGIVFVERKPGSTWGDTGGADVSLPRWVHDRIIAENEIPKEGETGWKWESFGWSLLYVSVTDETLRKQLESWRQQHIFVDGDFGRNIKFIRIGVPFRTLRGETWAHSADWIARNPGGSPIKMVGVFMPFGSAHQLPFLPIWPGFAINTIFYAVILGLLFFVPGKVRRAMRRRRGLCPACAYPVGTSEVCTECGYKLAESTNEAANHLPKI